MSKVSVVIATYNGEKYIEKQMDSLLAQSVDLFEILVGDDNSTDSTRDILTRYQKKYPKLIKLFFHEKNLGLNKNFEFLFNEAKGDFVAPCDQDDIWTHDKIEVLLSEIDDYPLVFSDSAYIDENDVDLSFSRKSFANIYTFDSALPLIFNNAVAGHSLLIRKDVLQRALPLIDDFPNDWWLAIVAASAGGCKFVDKKLVRYRIHCSNVSNPTFCKSRYQKYCSVFKNREKLRIWKSMIDAKVLKGQDKQIMLRLIDLYEAKEKKFFFSVSLYLELFAIRQSWWMILKKSWLKRHIRLLKEACGLRLKTLRPLPSYFFSKT